MSCVFLEHVQALRTFALSLAFLVVVVALHKQAHALHAHELLTWTLDTLVLHRALRISSRKLTYVTSTPVQGTVGPGSCEDSSPW